MHPGRCLESRFQLAHTLAWTRSLAEAATRWRRPARGRSQDDQYSPPKSNVNTSLATLDSWSLPSAVHRGVGAASKAPLGERKLQPPSLASSPPTLGV